MAWLNRYNIGFASAICLLLVIAGLTLRGLNLLITAGEWQVHSREVTTELERLNGLVRERQVCVRNYVLFGQAVYKSEFVRLSAETSETIGNLGRMTSDNPVQRNRIGSCRPFIDGYTTFADDVFRVYDSAGPDAARKTLQTGRGQTLIDRMIEVIDELRNAELQLLAKRDQDSADYATALTYILTSGCAAAIAAIAFGWRAVSVQSTARQGAQDLLSRKALELIKVNANLQQFAYVASHDLQEPLRKMITFTQLLQKDVGGDLPERARNDITYITDAATRMKHLIEALLVLSRAGRSDMNVELVPVERSVDEAMKLLSARCEETGAEILRDPLPHVRADGRLLTQLYQNLIGNALKFMPAGRRPRIHLTARQEQGIWILGVKDNGIGIRPEHHDQIFQPFKRLHGRAVYEGSGIGLAICTQVVERHGGRMWVESDEGAGAHFQFTLAPPKENQPCLDTTLKQALSS